MALGQLQGAYIPTHTGTRTVNPNGAQGFFRVVDGLPVGAPLLNDTGSRLGSINGAIRTASVKIITR